MSLDGVLKRFIELEDKSNQRGGPKLNGCTIFFAPCSIFTDISSKTMTRNHIRKLLIKGKIQRIDYTSLEHKDINFLKANDPAYPGPNLTNIVYILNKSLEIDLSTVDPNTIEVIEEKNVQQELLEILKVLKTLIQKIEGLVISTKELVHAEKPLTREELLNRIEEI